MVAERWFEVKYHNFVDAVKGSNVAATNISGKQLMEISKVEEIVIEEAYLKEHLGWPHQETYNCLPRNLQFLSKRCLFLSQGVGDVIVYYLWGDTLTTTFPTEKIVNKYDMQAKDGSVWDLGTMEAILEATQGDWYRFNALGFLFWCGQRGSLANW